MNAEDQAMERRTSFQPSNHFLFRVFTRKLPKNAKSGSLDAEKNVHTMEIAPIIRRGLKANEIESKWL